MKVVYATNYTFVLWFIASSYWTNSKYANSHTSNVLKIPKNQYPRQPTT